MTRSFEGLIYSRNFVLASLFFGLVWGAMRLPWLALAVIPIWFAFIRTRDVRHSLRGLRGSAIVFGILLVSSLVMSYGCALLGAGARYLISN